MSPEAFLDNYRRESSSREYAHQTLILFKKNYFIMIDKGEYPAGIICDLSRAFDCASHGIIFVLKNLTMTYVEDL